MVVCVLFPFSKNHVSHKCSKTFVVPKYPGHTYLNLFLIRNINHFKDIRIMSNIQFKLIFFAVKSPSYIFDRLLNGYLVFFGIAILRITIVASFFVLQLQVTARTLSQTIFLKLGFTPCKTEQPLRGMELQEKEAQKD